VRSPGDPQQPAARLHFSSSTTSRWWTTPPLFPNITLNIHSRFTWVFRHRPHADDPNRMFFDFWQLVRAPAHAIPRPAQEHLRASEGASLAHIPGGDVLDQDLYNLPRIQAGMRSASFPGLHLSSQEIRIRTSTTLARTSEVIVEADSSTSRDRASRCAP
jgi:hypothetical protein